MFINFPYDNINSAIIYHSISDQFSILLTIDLKLLNNSNIINLSYREINNTNNNYFIDKLKLVGWADIYKECNENKPDKAYSKFLETFLKTYDESFPIINNKNAKSKFKKPWMSLALYKSMKVKSKLYKNILIILL